MPVFCWVNMIRPNGLYIDFLINLYAVDQSAIDRIQ